MLILQSHWAWKYSDSDVGPTISKSDRGGWDCSVESMSGVLISGFSNSNGSGWLRIIDTISPNGLSCWDECPIGGRLPPASAPTAFPHASQGPSRLKVSVDMWDMWQWTCDMWTCENLSNDRTSKKNILINLWIRMDERCFRPLLCTVKAELGRGQPGLMRWIGDETLPQSSIDPLDLLLCSSPRYQVS